MQESIDKYKDSPEDLKKAGIEFTKEQMEGLLQHGVDGIHLYSMNKVEIAQRYTTNKKNKKRHLPPVHPVRQVPFGYR